MVPDEGAAMIEHVILLAVGAVLSFIYHRVGYRSGYSDGFVAGVAKRTETRNAP
jgi:hypothetical protein